MSFRWLALLAFLAVLLLWALVVLVSTSFEALGLSPGAATLVLCASLIGGWVNIPVWRRAVRVPEGNVQIGWWVFYRPPLVTEQFVAVNLGGAIVPLAVDAYLVSRVPLLSAGVATLGVALICFCAARPDPEIGILLPGLVAPLSAALLALVLAPGAAPPVAYMAGTLGALIGADLLHLREVFGSGGPVLSIGGAGVHDGIFLAGVVAVLLASL